MLLGPHEMNTSKSICTEDVEYLTFSLNNCNFQDAVVPYVVHCVYNCKLLNFDYIWYVDSCRRRKRRKRRRRKRKKNERGRSVRERNASTTIVPTRRLKSIRDLQHTL